MRLEWRGEIRRGYFVKGFSGIQFALPVVADQLLALHRQKTDDAEIVLINSCDPANLYGAGAPLAIQHPLHGDWQFRRQPQNYLILRGGIPLLAIEGLGKRLTPLQTLSDKQLKGVLAMLPTIVLPVNVALGIQKLSPPPEPSEAVLAVLLTIVL